LGGRKILSILDSRCFENWSKTPPHRHAFDELGVLVAGEAHADEPFAVDFLGHFFEQGDAVNGC
jgi:hypothetical protein